jgi:hypothetical protein
MPRKLLLIGVLLIVSMASGASDAPEQEVSTATMSLEEVLRLYRELDEIKRKEDVPPPVPASLDAVELKGRLLDAAVEITIRVQVSVLSDGHWAEVPILKLSPSLSLTRLPKLPNANLVVDEGQVVFVARVKGRYTFDLTLIQRADVAGTRRSAAVDTARATIAVLELEFDRSIFRLLHEGADEAVEDAVIFPVDGRFTIAWERLRPAEAATQESAPPPPVEPVIRRAHVSVVSTLAGHRVIRILYQLRLQSRELLRCRIPPGHEADKVYRNGLALPVPDVGPEVEVEALPARTGADAGTVELVLRHDLGSYQLAGNLEFVVPSVSWEVHELFLELHLPEVFNYTWTGGSLEPADVKLEAAYSYSVPTPGKRLLFHQYLVSEAAPRATLEYTIDLDGQYYRPEPTNWARQAR